MEMEGRRDNNNINKGGEMSSVVGEETTVDWRGRPSNPKHHGGMRAAAFVLGTYIHTYITFQSFYTCLSMLFVFENFF